MDLGTSLSTMNQTTQNLVNAYSAIKGAEQANKNYELQKENYDYQKSIQEQIFEREDTAVQRRRADLEAAGLNPNLAAGSSAGAGSVVSTIAPQKDMSWLNHLKFNLDYITSIEQVRQARLQTENMRKQSELLTSQKQKADEERKSVASNNYILSRQNAMDRVIYLWKTGQLSDDELIKNQNLILPFIMQNEIMYNQEKLLKKDNKWYTPSKIWEMISGAVKAGASLKAPGSGW